MSHNNRDFAAEMRARGYRVTPQRQMILDAICASGGHVTPEEIYNRVHVLAPALSRATVYRNVEFLGELGLVVAIQIGGQTAYEIAGETPHHHLVCRRCGQQQALEHALVVPLARAVQQRHQFHVDVSHVALTGLCAQCARSEADG